jgi:AbrB family looped-hinge helix DNA binding protein
MAPLIARLTSKGQFTLPRRLREALGVKPGDYVALTPTADGVLISAAEVAVRRPTDETLVVLVRQLGEQVERQGIVDEAQLDDAIAVSKRQAYEQRYGGRAP